MVSMLLTIFIAGVCFITGILLVLAYFGCVFIYKMYDYGLVNALFGFMKKD